MAKSEKKNRWVLKFVVFAIICLIISVAGSHAVPNLPNIIAVIYIIAGIVWFYMHTRAKVE